jgi:Helix-loop-helix DNA-binding domain
MKEEGDESAMDDDGEDESVLGGGGGGRRKGSRKKNKLEDSKREERNAREKERSFRISRQINELRSLLSSGGVIVPKGTKSSVLTEAANYIRMLQQHQYRSEM